MIRNTQYKITVPKPCKERWENMTTKESGRYCDVCCKVVTDFTRMTDAEILLFFSDRKGNTCGRFSESQLNRPIYMASRASFHKNLYKLFAGLFFLGVSKNATAEKNISLNPQIQIAGDRFQKTVKERVPDTSSRFISGRVLDSATQKPLPYTMIVLSGEQGRKSVISDSTGYYQLKIAEDDLAGESVTVKVWSVGFNTACADFKTKNLPLKHDFFLSGVVTDDDLVVVVAGGAFVTHKKWWQFWKWFRKRY